MNNWRTDKPQQGKFVYVWGNCTDTVKAYWSGKVWRNEAGQVVWDVTHWREIPVAPVTAEGISSSIPA